MVYESIQLDETEREPLYEQLYRAIRTAIEQGRLAPNSRVPSIRRGAEDWGISRTTVEEAYQQLCVEGYLRNVPKRGFFVQGGSDPQKLTVPAIKATPVILPPRSAIPMVSYDFGTESVDAAHTDSVRWQKQIRQVLADTTAIASYGDPQGESSLRRALSVYTYHVRGVTAPPERIVIGAGIQPLLIQLCALLSEKRIAMPSAPFPQAERVFADAGFEIVRLSEDESGPVPGALQASGVHQVLLTPSSGRVIPPARRQELLKWARDNGGWLIEDDYNGELRYRARPVPALQGMGGEDWVAYIGSFSKLLLPSVRLGYMVLPPRLCKRYSSRSLAYHQTASKIEQLALASYISEGYLEKHLRRMRKLYAEKSSLLLRALRDTFGSGATVSLRETSLSVRLTLPGLQGKLAVEAAAKNGVRLRADGEKQSSLILGFAGIPSEKITEGVRELEKSIRGLWK